MELADHPAKKIRFLLHTNTMTIQALAERVGVTKESMREIVDELAMPTPHLLHRICGVFGVNESYFGEAIKSRALSPHTTPGPGSSQESWAPKAAVLAPAGPKGLRRKRKLDLADLALRHQALIECLVQKKIIAPEEYMKRLEALRSKREARRPR